MPSIPEATASLFASHLPLTSRARSGLAKLSRLSDASHLDIEQARAAQADVSVRYRRLMIS